MKTVANGRSPRIIKVTDDAKERLAKIFGCTKRSVYSALCYSSESEKAERIRHIARRDMGGWIEAAVPEEEMFYDVTEDGRHVMRQYYGNGAVLEVSMDDGTGRVMYKGKTLVTVENVMVSDMPAMQETARSLK